MEKVENVVVRVKINLADENVKRGHILINKNMQIKINNCVNVYPPPPIQERGCNDTCIFGPIYGFIQNNYIFYENTWENRH